MKDTQVHTDFSNCAFLQKGKLEALPSYDQFVRNLFPVISATIVLTYALGILAYGEAFLFSEYAISDLGATVTKHGRPNLNARIVMTIGMLICSFMMLRIGLHYGQSRSLRNQRFKRLVAVLCAGGFFLFTCPLNVNYVVHSIGAGLIIGCLYLFDNCFLFEQRLLMPALVFWGSQLILQATVLTYAVAYITTAAIKQISQKCCIAGLLVVSLLSVRRWNWRNNNRHELRH
jgi:hypothetical protein